MLELINVKKIYTTKAGDTVALNNVSLKFGDTGMVFINGKSGSGKTTLLNVIGGLDGIDGGDILIDGRSFSSFTPAEYDSYRNTFIGFIFQEYNLLPDYTIEKNIKIATELQGLESDEEKINDTLETLEIGGLNKRKPSQLSGGQKQRVAIARSLIKNPKIIMADEPTGALDSATGIQVMECLKVLSKEKLVIVISHDLELAEKYADRIIKIVDGQIVEDLTLFDTLITSGVYDTEDGIAVKTGVKLTSKEAMALISAIENKQKVTFVENESLRKRENTKTDKIKYNGEPAKFIKSKMKTKSAAELGVKSLSVKPGRLILTIILSVIAFAVFGLFDTVAAFTNTRAITNLLKTSGYSGVALTASYKDDNYKDNKGNGQRIRFTDDMVKKLSKESGYKFRPVYDLKFDGLADDKDVLSVSMYSMGGAFESLETYPITKKGNEFYTKKTSGFIEFTKDEISYSGEKEEAPAIIDKNGFNLKLTHGRYPKFEVNELTGYPVQEEIEIAISKHLAVSIALRTNGLLGEGKFDVDEICEKVISKKLEIKLSNSYPKVFRIVGIIDTGKIPKKYEVLSTTRNGMTVDTALKDDYLTFLNSGLHLNLFVADGVFNYMYKDSGRAEAAFSGTEVYDFYFKDYETTKDKTVVSKSQFFRSDKVNAKNVIMFDNPREESAYELNDGEIIIDARNIDDLFSREDGKITLETNLGGLGIKGTDLGDIKNIIDTAAKEPCVASDGVRQAVEDYLDFIKEIFEKNLTTYPTDDQASQKTLNKKVKYVQSNDNGTITKTYTVVGVFVGLPTDGTRVDSMEIYPTIHTAKDLEELGVYVEQGTYQRIVAPLKKNNKGAKYIANLMTKDSGLYISWYGNQIVAIIDSESEFISQFAQLFLYVALVLALFSIVMMYNYISASILSKKQSIGVLRALGSGGKDIFKMFMTESLIISLIDGILACGLGALGCVFVNMYVKEVMNLFINFAMFGFRQIIIIMAISIITAFLSSLIPIIRISKEKPVKLIREP